MPLDSQGKEPTAVLHNVPVSQVAQHYSNADTVSTPGGGSGGGVGATMWENIKAHWMVYAGVGVVAAIIIYVVYNRYQQQSAATNVLGGTAQGTGTGVAPDQLWGSQLDADMQQMMQFQNQGNAMLATLTTPTTPSTPLPPTDPNSPSRVGAQPFNGWTPFFNSTVQVWQDSGKNWWEVGSDNLAHMVSGEFAPGTSVYGGGQGRVWYKTPGGQQQMLTATGWNVKNK